MAKQKKKYRLKKKVKIVFLMICFISGVLGLYFVWPKKDELGKITLPSLREKVVITLSRENIYLARDEKITIEFSPEDLSWSSSDESIATVEQGVITGKSPGVVTITASKRNVSKSIYVTVTDLIILPEINNKKQFCLYD